MTDTQTQSLEAMLEPHLAAEGVELDDLRITGGGKGRAVKVVVDAEGGLDVDRIAELTHGISRLLDDDPGLQTGYTLEVTSPGLERDLRRPRHFEKSVGREARVTVRRGESSESMEGRIESVDETGFDLVGAFGSRRIAFGDVIKGRTVFTWERGDKPGKKKR